MRAQISREVKQQIWSRREEATGIRFVKMIIEEYFCWGYVETPQRNDDGIDGTIIVRNRKGEDTGSRIIVQVKSGPGYLYERKDGIMSINAYPKKHDSFKKHQQLYDSQMHPVILVYVNALRKDKYGKEFWDLRNPKAWWIQLNNYQNADGAAVYRIDPKSTFGEHSKQDLLKLVGDSDRDWLQYDLYDMTLADLKQWNSFNIRNDAFKIYQQWKKSNPQVEWVAEMDGTHNNIPLIVTKTGWKHINNGRRGRLRITKSLRLMSAVVGILSEPVSPFKIREGYKGPNATESFYAVRRRVKIGKEEKKVQILLRRWENKLKGIDKLWFYSVHTIKD